VAQAERAQENAKQSRRDKQREGRRGRAATTARADLRNGDWLGIAALITAFAEAGGAIRIGFTRDGGALAVGCYLGDDYATEYVRPQEDFRGALIEIAEAWLPDQGIAYHQALQEYEQAAKPRK